MWRTWAQVPIYCLALVAGRDSQLRYRISHLKGLGRHVVQKEVTTYAVCNL